MSASKTCARCGATRPLTEFSPARRMRDGRSSWCRPCATEANRRWRAAGTRYIDVANAARRVQHPPRPCHGCGLPFPPLSIKSRHCCERCRGAQRANGRPLTPEGAADHIAQYHAAAAAAQPTTNGGTR